MKSLQNLFKRKKTLMPSTALKLCIIDDNTSDLWITLGITDQRREEIIQFCKDAFDNHDTKTGSYTEIVDKCTHVNEVVPACIIFERLCDVHNDPLSGLMQVLGRENH
jgi:hypothetical protein